MRFCPRCKINNPPTARFCNNCGLQFIQQGSHTPIHNQPKETFFDKQVGALWAWFWGLSIKGKSILLGSTFAAISIFAIAIAVIAEQQKNSSIANEKARQEEIARNATPVPTPIPPPTFAELKTKGEQLLKFERNEYAQSDLKQFDDVMQPLKAIPKEDKNYKEAQKLNKKLIDKTAPIAAEIVVLGEKPDKGDLYVAFNQYLRPRLNDYDSSEYVNYTPAYKVYVKKEPFWVSVLSLRAKNAFGGYILKDVTMYIRQKEVVLADGL